MDGRRGRDRRLRADLLRRHEPAVAERLRVVATTVPAPSPPLVASPAIDAAMRERLTAALCRAHEAPAMSRALRRAAALRFVRVAEADFEVFLDRAARGRSRRLPEARCARVRGLIRGGWVVGFGGGTHALFRDGVVVVRRRPHRPRGPALRGLGRPRDRRAGQARRARLHRHARALRPPRVPPADHGHRPPRLLRPALPRHQRAARGHARGRRSALPASGRARRRGGTACTPRSRSPSCCATASPRSWSSAASCACRRRSLPRSSASASAPTSAPATTPAAGWADARGRLKRVVDEAAGRREFEARLDFIRRVDGTPAGACGASWRRARWRRAASIYSAPRAQIAGELRMPIVTHAAYSVIEFYEMLREHRHDARGAARVAGAPRARPHHRPRQPASPRTRTCPTPAGRDARDHGPPRRDRLALPGEHRAARPLRSIPGSATAQAGINLALGSDTYPRDLIMQMRTASYFGKVMSRDLSRPPPPTCSTPPRSAARRALGRDDLGRLAPGAKADIVMIDLTGGGTLRYGPVRDPDQEPGGVRHRRRRGDGHRGRRRAHGGDRLIPGVDFAALRAPRPGGGEDVWSRLPEWDPLGRTAEEMSPWSFPLAQRDPWMSRA